MSYTLSPDATWLAWFSGPLSIRTGDFKHTQAIRRGAQVIAIQEDLRGGVAPVETVLATHSPADDHDMCGVVRRKNDQRLIFFYGQHDGASGINYKISTNADRSDAFGAELRVNASQTGYAYGWPCYIGNRLYIFSRRTGPANERWIQYFYSDSHGDSGTWNGPWNLIVSTPEIRSHVYICFDSDRPADDRIDAICSQVRFSDSKRLHVKHFYLAEDGVGNLAAYTSAGVKLADHAGSPKAFPIEFENDPTMVYDSLAGGNNEQWCWGVKSSGLLPALISSEFVTVGTDHRWVYWLWNGSAWSAKEEIVNAGGTPAVLGGQGTDHYSCGAYFGDTTADLYLGIGNNDGSRVSRWKRTGVNTWVEEEVLGGRVGNLVRMRPIRPESHDGQADPRADVLWIDGYYTTYTNFDTTIQVHRKQGADMTAAGWTWVCELDITSSLVNGGPHGEALVLITHNANLPSNFWSIVKNGGADIRVSLGRSNPSGDIWLPLAPIACKAVRCDTSLQRLELWVKHDGLLPSGQINKIQIWYGNTGAARSSGSRLGVDAQGFPTDEQCYHHKIISGGYHFDEQAGDFQCFLGLLPALQAFGTVNRQALDPWGNFGVEMLNNAGHLEPSPASAIQRDGNYEAWFDDPNANAENESWVLGQGLSNDDGTYCFTMSRTAGALRNVRCGRTGSNTAEDTTAPAGWKYVYFISNFASEVQVNDRAAVRVTAAGMTPDRARVGGLGRQSSITRFDGLLAEKRFFYTGPVNSARRNDDFHATLWKIGNNQATLLTPGTPLQIGTPAERGPVKIGALSTGTQQTGASPFDITATVNAAGNNRALLVGVSHEGSSSTLLTIDSVILDPGGAAEKALTRLALQTVVDHGVELWWLPDADMPAAGDYTLRVAATHATGGTFSFVVSALNIWDAAQTAPTNIVYDSDANGTTLSMPITTSEMHSLVYSVYATDNSPGVTHYPQGVQVYHQTSNTNTGGATREDRAAASAVTVTHDFGGILGEKVGLTVELESVAAPSPPVIATAAAMIAL